jgi:hypothetical protein
MIRTIIVPKEQTISLCLPEAYIGKQIEIIAFAQNEGSLVPQSMPKSREFTVLKVGEESYTFNRDEANER